MSAPTKDFEKFFAMAKRIYAELETLPRNERVAIVSLVDQFCEYQCASEDMLADADDAAADQEGDEWKKYGRSPRE